jgi:hypothetical protein
MIQTMPGFTAERSIGPIDHRYAGRSSQATLFGVVPSSQPNGSCDSALEKGHCSVKQNHCASGYQPTYALRLGWGNACACHCAQN